MMWPTLLLDKGLNRMPDAKQQMSPVVSEWCSCHFHTQCPCYVNSKCAYTYLCNLGRDGVKVRFGQMHWWRSAVLRQQKVHRWTKSRNITVILCTFNGIMICRQLWQSSGLIRRTAVSSQINCFLLFYYWIIIITVEYTQSYNKYAWQVQVYISKSHHHQHTLPTARKVRSKERLSS